MPPAILLLAGTLVVASAGTGRFADPHAFVQKKEKGQEKSGDAKKGEAKKVTVSGKLNHPVVAIGGETTGTVVETAKDGNYELELGGKKDLVKLAESLAGKQVEVKGTVKTVKGVEGPDRKVVTVEEMKEVKK
jgi:hypothetical protein